MSERQDVDRAERAARNEALFREVNERLDELAATFQAVSEKAIFVCECADGTCIEKIEMSLDEYEAVRSRPEQFAVLPAHVYPDVERIEQETKRYVVVAKIGEAAAIAEAADPRS
jgi:hypothetical protein